MAVQTVGVAGATPTAAGPAKLLRDYFESVMLRAFEKDIIVKDLTKSVVFPANSGRTVVFHRINNFAKAISGISSYQGSPYEPINVTGGDLKLTAYTVDQISATLGLFGNDMVVDEMVTMCNEPNPMPELSKRFLFNGADTMDQLCINLMVCSTANGTTQTSTVPSIEYAGSSTSVSVIWGDGSSTLTEATLDADNPVHRISAETFNQAYGTLRSRSVSPHPKMAGRRYAALISPGVGTDLRVDATFQEIALKGQRSGESKFEAASIGDVFGCVVMESPNIAVNQAGTIDSTNDEIVRCLVFGDDYCQTVSHASGAGRPRVSYIPPTPSSADPYGNMGFLTWKFYFAGVVTNPYAGVILKVATTAATPTVGGEWGDSS